MFTFLFSSVIAKYTDSFSKIQNMTSEPSIEEPCPTHHLPLTGMSSRGL